MKYVVTGQTGSGKTYKTIKKCSERGPFAFLAPTRLLCYEVFMSFALAGRDNLKTGLVKIDGEPEGNFYGTPMSLKIEDVSKYNSIIIDEVHWLLNCDEQSRHMAAVIKEAERLNKNIFLLTADNNFRTDGAWKILRHKSPIKIIKNEITLSEAWDRAHEGVPTLVIASSIAMCDEISDDLNDEGMCHGLATRRHWENNIVDTFLSFRKNEIKILVCSNIAAQGVNLPCENLILCTNEYDDRTSYNQKLGRLGRPSFFKKGSALTYAVGGGGDLFSKTEKRPSLKKMLKMKSILEQEEDRQSFFNDEEAKKTKEIILNNMSRNERLAA